MQELRGEVRKLFMHFPPKFLPTGYTALRLALMTVVTTHRWWRGTVVERRSLVGELSLSCA